MGVLTHSGEFATTSIDLELPGRGGVAPTFSRRYRSSVADEPGDFGRGHTWTYSKRLVERDDGVRFDDGRCERHHFVAGAEHVLRGLIEFEAWREAGGEVVPYEATTA